MWITLDLDNTLVANPYWHLFFRPWLTAEAQRQGTTLATLYDALNAEAERRWRHGQWVESFDWADIVHALGLTPLPDPPIPPRAAVARLVKTGAWELLGVLQTTGLPLGLVSNGFLRFQWPYLKALGWDRLFQAIVTPDQVGYAKPDPRMLAPCSPGMVHIGDRLTHDVLLAQRAHRRAIWVTDPDAPREHDRLDPLMSAGIQADWRVASLKECLVVLQAWISKHFSPL
ncbi:MAG: HAD family hydrolase [Firmicutes bacterium]|nr:HAD family hydrolase [Bacillota bacterium]